MVSATFLIGFVMSVHRIQGFRDFPNATHPIVASPRASGSHLCVGLRIPTAAAAAVTDISWCGHMEWGMEYRLRRECLLDLRLGGCERDLGRGG
jgi:hypothetical protein